LPVILLACMLACGCKSLCTGFTNMVGPNVDCPESARKPATLELKIVDDFSGEAFFMAAAQDLEPGDPFGVKSQEQWGGEDKRYWFEAWDEQGGLSGREMLEEFLGSHDLPASRSLGCQLIDPVDGRWEAMLLVEPAVMTNEHIAGAKAALNKHDKMPVVQVVLTEEGKAIFAEVTAENTKRRLAIVVDGVVVSAPVIQERISGGKLQIALGGHATFDEAWCEAESLAEALDPQ
jgi:preprotein translocase subunit SecD